MSNLKEQFLKTKHAHAEIKKAISKKLRALQVPVTAEQLVALTEIPADGIGCMELAKNAGLLGPSISRMLPVLELHGYVQVRGHRTDARKSLVVITPKGKKLVAKLDA